jgi:hypothetical protein
MTATAALIPVATRGTYTNGLVPTSADIIERQLFLNLGDTDWTLYSVDKNGVVKQIGVVLSQLATVATTGNFSDLVGAPSNLGGLSYQGTYNAATATPTLPTPASGNNGYQYIVNTAGTLSTNTGGVTLNLNVGDAIISNGTIWQQVLAVPNDFEISMSVQGNPVVGTYSYTFTKSINLPANFTSSQAFFTLTSGTTTTVNVYKGNVSAPTSLTGIGTITWASGAATFTTTSGAVSFNAGDFLQYQWVNSNIATASITLYGTKA